jgi:hypothetical protein
VVHGGTLMARLIFVFTSMTRVLRFNLNLCVDNNKNMQLKHGPTMSIEAYQEAIDNLYSEYADVRDIKVTDELLRKELELTIDHRLGVFFPRERRNHLWLVQQRIATNYLKFGKYKAIMYWLISFIRPQVLVTKLEELNSFAVQELESAFTKEELIAFAGGPELISTTS